MSPEELHQERLDALRDLNERLRPGYRDLDEELELQDD